MRRFGFLFIVGFGCGVSFCQQQVMVDVGTTLNPLTQTSMGVYTVMGDGEMITPATLTALRIGGLTTITYPTGWDSTSNVYHWYTNKLAPKAGNASAPKAPYLSGRNDFGSVATALAKTGMTAIINVNYGSNAAATGGAVPQEAAAWVAYCNGLPTDGRVLGVDANGYDWKTTGFWAGLRAAAPTNSDDGFNFLRIEHPDPLHIQLWQVGEDEANNGYYGGDHKGTLDLHAPYPAAAADNDKRKKLKELSPAFYGEQVATFAAAMKAVDPTIQVGATLTTPTVETFAPDWNSTVLKASCKDIDFVTYDGWHPGGVLPPDWKILDLPQLLGTPATDLPNIFAESVYEAKKSCPAGKVPRVVMEAFGPQTWPENKAPAAMAVFSAEAFSEMAISGIANASWQGGIYGKDNKLLPAYYGAQMLHTVASRAGDAFVKTSGAKGSVVAVAVHRRDGNVGVLLTNHSPDAAAQVKVMVAGADLAGPGNRFEYGPAQYAKGSGPERAAVTADGNSVVVSVPAYGVVALQLVVKK